MSRCFPFPPPGYERKTKADSVDLLKKEKLKEKKHKKEKKDKEKKEDKEKREKERSDEKHREKKDKKEKHKDKKKDKEKDRDKDRSKSDLLLTEEKKVVGSSINHVHKLPEKSKDHETVRNPNSSEKKIGWVSGVHNGMPVSNNHHQVHETNSFKHMSDLGRKSMDEKRGLPNQLSDKNVGLERKKEGVVLAANSGVPLPDMRERSKDKPTLDGRGVIGDARFTGHAMVPNSVGMVPNSVGMVQNRVVAGNRPLEKKIEQKVDGKEKAREKGGDDRKGERRKEKDREKSKFKDKDREKEKKEIMKGTSEEKHIQMTRPKDGGENNMMKSNVKDANKKDFTGVQSSVLDHITKDSNVNTINNNIINNNKNNNYNNNNHRKRKDPGLNGIYDELVVGPNKLARASASPHPLSENGRSADLFQTPSPMNMKVEPRLAPFMKIKVECKVNGTFPESSRETVPKPERKLSDVPTKAPPPHPDTKYLKQVLSVPKMEELSDIEDQEWLFERKSSLTKKPEVNIDVTPEVWSRGLWLDPVDVYALPYVIPH